ncbi:MAG: HpcH/HpaI aldolase/citrate lyase family protein [Dermatophilaceae bacterium]
MAPLASDAPRAAAARAVTWLFVPGDRPERFERARGSGADEVICDLEDAVHPERKQAAREQVCRWLSSGGSGWVRVNAADTGWLGDDVDALAGVPGLRGIVVPKAEDPGVVDDIRGRVPATVGIVALVESARGVVRAHDLAGSGAVDRLAFGSIDYAVDIDAAEDDETLLLARLTLVLASRAASKPGPIDGVTRSVDDAELIGAEARRSRRLGFAAKLCIHPAQLQPVASGFAPTPQEAAWARKVLDALEGDTPGAVTVDGQMVDKPVVDRARRILERAAHAVPVNQRPAAAPEPTGRLEQT